MSKNCHILRNLDTSFPADIGERCRIVVVETPHGNWFGRLDEQIAYPDGEILVIVRVAGIFFPYPSKWRLAFGRFYEMLITGIMHRGMLHGEECAVAKSAILEMSGSELGGCGVVG